MNFMKKLKYILIIAFFLCFVSNVNAAECNLTEDSVTTYFAGDYANVAYCYNYTAGCDGSKNLCTSGCFPLTIASILKSYGSDITPSDVSTYLCENFRENAQNVTYGSILSSTNFEDQFNMQIENIGDTMTALDEALDEGKSVLASVSSASIFANQSHYIGVVLKDGNNYLVINTASKEDENRTTGWFSREMIETNVINARNQGIWSIEPTTCSSSSSGSGTNVGGGRLEDEYDEWGDIFPGFDPVDNESGCSTIFIDQNGNYTALYDFMQDLFSLIKIAAPALVIILSTIDYIKAITNSNADEMKKANGRTIKRLIIGLIIFFLPFILDILFELLGLYDLSRCNLGT